MPKPYLERAIFKNENGSKRRCSVKITALALQAERPRLILEEQIYLLQRQLEFLKSECTHSYVEDTSNTSGPTGGYTSYTCITCGKIIES